MAKDFARGFYDSPEWRKTREAYLSSVNYICEDCGGAACIVHHIEHITAANVDNPEITLNWDNLKAVCEKCHAEEHAKDKKAFKGTAARLNGIAFDEEGNAVASPNVFLICGSPGSGKTTYVQEHKGPRDLVIDMDYICAALQGEAGDIRTDHRPIIAVAAEVRGLLYEIIQQRRGQWERAFVVSGVADALEMRALANELGAQLVLLETPLAECVKRIKDDPQRARNRKRFVKLAAEWHEKYKQSCERVFIPPTNEKRVPL